MPCKSYGQKHTSSRPKFRHLWRTPVYFLQETSLIEKAAHIDPCFKCEKHCTISQVQLFWFLRILLPVLLLQNLRCKVRDDTAKLDIALLTNEQSNQKNLNQIDSLNDLKSHKQVRHRFRNWTLIPINIWKRSFAEGLYRSMQYKTLGKSQKCIFSVKSDGGKRCEFYRRPDLNTVIQFTVSYDKSERQVLNV